MGAQTPRRARATIQVAAASRFTRRQQPRRKKGFTPCALCLTGSSPRSPSRSPCSSSPVSNPSALPRPGSALPLWDCSSTSSIRSSNRSSRLSRCRSRSLRSAFSSSCSTALCWSSPATCRSTCWASASPSPALARPLWAAS